MLNLFEIAGIAGVLLLIIVLILLPIIVTFVVGIAFANLLGFTGLTWWCFIILFYIIISGILGLIGK